MSNWERLSAWPGGTVAGLATIADATTTLVFAASSAGVFRSSDGGCTWTATSRGSIVPFNDVIGSSPELTGNHTLFVGGRNGAYRSRDGGASWVHVLTGGRILGLAVTRDIVLLGTELDGILRSEDGGLTFVGANAGLLDLTVLSLAVSPHFERDRIAFAATPSGVYRSRNAGKSWRAVDLGPDELAVQCLAVSPGFGADRLVFAGSESDGLLRSDDAGTTWDLVLGLEGRSITALAFSRRVIAAATDAGIAISNDQGRSWRMTASDLGPVLSLIFVEHGDTEVLLAGLHRVGVARVTTFGDSWALANDGLQARVLVSLAVSPDAEPDVTIFAAGPDEGVLVSADGGRTWTAHVAEVEDPSILGVVVSPNYFHDQTAYAATSAGIYRSDDAGRSWALLEGGGAESEMTIALTAGPRHADGGCALLAALPKGRLFLSEDSGETWRPCVNTFNDGEIVSLVYAHDGSVFVGTHRAGEVTLWRSVDGGSTWQRWLVERGADPLPLAVPQSSPLKELVYVGAGNRVLKPIRRSREVHSGDQRPLWSSVEVGGSITALAAADAATVFAATSQGVYVSRDGADHFTLWEDGEGPRAVVAIAVSPDYTRDRLVYALEMGGAIWRRRDCS